MRYLLVLFTLSALVACSSEEPRKWTTAREAASAQCVAMCQWGLDCELLEIDGDVEGCIKSCVANACHYTDNDCRDEPNNSDEDVDACIASLEAATCPGSGENAGTGGLPTDCTFDIGHQP